MVPEMGSEWVRWVRKRRPGHGCGARTGQGCARMPQDQRERGAKVQRARASSVQRCNGAGSSGLPHNVAQRETLCAWDHMVRGRTMGLTPMRCKDLGAAMWAGATGRWSIFGPPGGCGRSGSSYMRGVSCTLLPLFPLPTTPFSFFGSGFSWKIRRKHAPPLHLRPALDFLAVGQYPSRGLCDRQGRRLGNTKPAEGDMGPSTDVPLTSWKPTRCAHQSAELSFTAGIRATGPANTRPSSPGSGQTTV